MAQQAAPGIDMATKTVTVGAFTPITGPVPAYLTNQIANYQAALARLSGGG